VYYQQGQDAKRAGAENAPLPEDFLAGYSDALQRVMPHLTFVRLDPQQRRLIYNSSGAELPYEELSGGERELAFLVGQIERFGVRDGVFLLDEPELYLNAELLRGWLDYLREAVGDGQVWIATHALEAAEVSGLESTLVLERSDDRQVRSAKPLAGRPALRTLAGQLGTPAFSIARSRFLLIEGERPRGEGERFSRLLDSPNSDHFIESHGHRQLLALLEGLRALASEEEQLRVGGFIDRDFHTDEEAADLEQEHDVCVLPVHEIENFYLQPEALVLLGQQAGKAPVVVTNALLDASDQFAGRWIRERALHLDGADWDAPSTNSLQRLNGVRWSQLGGTTILDQAVEEMPDLDDTQQAQRRNALRTSCTAYQALRDNPDQLWRKCLGKEVLTNSHLAQALDLTSGEAIEDRVTQLWKEEAVPRPPDARKLRDYIDSISVLT